MALVNGEAERTLREKYGAVAGRHEQTKALVAGLKDILKDCLKSY